MQHIQNKEISEGRDRLGRQVKANKTKREATKGRRKKTGCICTCGDASQNSNGGNCVRRRMISDKCIVHHMRLCIDVNEGEWWGISAYQ